MAIHLPVDGGYIPSSSSKSREGGGISFGAGSFSKALHATVCVVLGHPEWMGLKKEFGFSETSFCQGHHGGQATKPTTMGGNLELDVEGNRMKRPTSTTIASSSELARWAPGVMKIVAKALLSQVVHREPRLAPLSWQEHIQHGHIPFRRDCLVCQQSLEQQPQKGEKSLGRSPVH